MLIGYDVGNLILPNFTGIGNYVYSLLNALLKLNNKDKYKLLSFSPVKIKPYISTLNLVKSSRITYKNYKIPSFMFNSLFNIWQKINFPSIDYFLPNINLYHSFDWYCPAAKQAKIVATIFDVSPLVNKSWYSYHNYQQHWQRLKSITKNSNHITTLSHHAKQEIIKYLNICQEKITVAYPGVDNNKFKLIKNIPKISLILKKYNLKPGFLLYTGTLDKRKNISGIIKAYLSLPEKYHLEHKLVLAGEKGNDINLITKSTNIICLNHINFLNNDLLALYQSASMLVFPSFYEGFGMPILEAMACGCPVVTSNLSSMPEAAGNAGILVNPYETKEISRAIKQILDSRLLTDNLKQKGLIQAKKFTWEKCALQTYKVYKKLLS